MQLRLTYNDYLVTLLVDLGAAEGRLASAPQDQRAAMRATARSAAARASARLDGSPLEPATADEVDAGRWEPSRTDGAAGRSAGGWAAALRLEGMATQEVAAVEYANLLAAYDAEEELAAGLWHDPSGVLARLHGLICQGLVDPEVIGRHRSTEQAVHDGAQGMVIYNPPDPVTVPRLLAELDEWLRSGASAALPAAVVAAVVHERLLQWQPFEAGNGRVARAAARLVLRARGLTGAPLVTPEQQWAADPAGYYGEVAATLRRRDDLTLWVERHTEVLLAAAEGTLACAGLAPGGEPDGDVRQALDDVQPGQTITVAEHAQRRAISVERATEELRHLAVWGHLVREPRTLGRRFRRR